MKTNKSDECQTIYSKVGTYYSRGGQLTGYTNAEGKYFDRDGRLVGYTAADGRKYDKGGRLVTFIRQ